MKTRSVQLACLAVSLSLFASCVKDDLQDLSVPYSGTLAFPVAQVGFTLGEALADDTLLTVDADNAIRLVYRNEGFFSISAAEYLDEIIGDLAAAQEVSFQLGTVPIEDISTTASVPFADILADFSNSSLQTMLSQNSGNSLPIPAFLELLDESIDVPGFSDFNFMEIENGSLQVTVTNGLFFEVKNMVATIIDNTNSEVVGTLHFDAMPIGVSLTKQLELAGKTIGNDFRVVLSLLETAGTAGVPVMVDLQSALQFKVEVKDVSIQSGEVSLPVGTIVEDGAQFELQFDGGEQLTSIELASGLVGYELSSDLAANFLLRLTFPDMLLNGSQVVKEITVNQPMVTGTLDFSNTTWRLDQNGSQPFNKMQVEYEVVLPSGSNGMVSFSADQEVSLKLMMQQVDPVLVSGFLGEKTLEIEPGIFDLGIDFGVFDPSSGPILFSDPTIRIWVENSFGLPLSLDFEASANGQFGGQAALGAPSPLSLNFPGQGMAGQSVLTEFVFDKTNSSVVDLLSVFPASINYAGTATANTGAGASASNFVTSSSQLSASAEIELPFRFRASNLTVRQTGAGFDLGLDGGLTIDNIDSATLKIVYTNGLPLTSTFELLTVGPDGQESVLFDNLTMEAATTDSNGRVVPGAEAEGELFLPLSRSQIRQLDEAVENIYLVKFDTPDNGQAPASMYTDYRVDLNIGMTLKLDR